MLCSFCKTAGYNFPKAEGKYWCGTCDGGPKTLTKMTFGNSPTFLPSGFSPAPYAGLCTLAEWNEVVVLCRKVGRYVLTEEAAANLPVDIVPLPNLKNPLNEKPTDKRAGWTPLVGYFSNEAHQSDVHQVRPNELNKVRKYLHEG